MKHISLFSTVSVFLSCLMLLVSCNGKNDKTKESQNAEMIFPELPPSDDSDDSNDSNDRIISEQLKRLAKAIGDGDAVTVADYVDYPLKRPSPIPPIENKEQFIKYFPILFDEPIRNMIQRDSDMKSWVQVGFKGVMFFAGEFWVDGTFASGGNIFAVNYHSEPERKLRISLMEKEKKTLHESLLKEDFVPVFCFEMEDGKTAGRVDEVKDDLFRISLFSKPVHPCDEPQLVFYACAVYEGSGGNHYYLDNKWLYVLSVNIVGSMDMPPLDIRTRSHWSEELGEEKPATYQECTKIINASTSH